jgi:hypothetical protein
MNEHVFGKLVEMEEALSPSGENSTSAMAQSFTFASVWTPMENGSVRKVQEESAKSPVICGLESWQK